MTSPFWFSQHRGTGHAAELHQEQRQGGAHTRCGAHELHLVLPDQAVPIPWNRGDGGDLATEKAVRKAWEDGKTTGFCVMFVEMTQVI